MTVWEVETNNQQQNSVVVNAMLILEKLNRNFNSMAQTIAEVDSETKQGVDVFRKLEELAFESNLLALSASLEEVRASEVGEEKSALIAKKVFEIAMKAADATKMVGNVMGEYRQIYRNWVVPFNKVS